MNLSVSLATAGEEYLSKVRAHGADQLDLHLSRREQVLNCPNGNSAEPLGVAQSRQQPPGSLALTN